MNTIITIGRQFGSGGREIGIRLAKALNVPFYDKELLRKAAEKSGLCEKIFENFDERPKSLLYSIAMDSYMFALPGAGAGDSLEQQVYLATFNTIRHIAEQGPCVIIGRCAGYLTREQDNAFSVFIHADMDKRIAAVMARDHINSRLKAKRKIEEIDEKRSTFRKEFTGEEWGQSKYYNLSIDTTHLSYQQAADLILYYKKLAEEAQK